MALILSVGVSLFGCGNKETAVKKPVENISREEKEVKQPEEKKADTEEDNSDEQKEESKENEKDESKQDAQPVKEPEVKNEAPAVKLGSIRSEIKSSLAISDAADLDADSISGLYGINPSDIKDAAGFVVMAGTFPHEVVMVEAKDASAADRIESMLSAKHQSFVEQSKGYDAENYALAQKCKVVRKGNQLSMFLTPDYETMQGVYNRYIK